jgi:hypothetical protein
LIDGDAEFLKYYQFSGLKPTIMVLSLTPALRLGLWAGLLYRALALFILHILIFKKYRFNE